MHFSEDVSAVLNICVDRRKLSSILSDTTNLKLVNAAFKIQTCLKNYENRNEQEKLLELVNASNFELICDTIKLLNETECNVVLYSNYQMFLLQKVDVFQTDIDIVLKLLELCMDLGVFYNKEINEMLENKLNSIIISILKSSDKKVLSVICSQLPQYLKLIKSKNSLLNLIWDSIQEEESLSMLCLLEDIFLPKPWRKEIYSLINLDAFWLLLQKNVTVNDIYIQKVATHLLKRSFDIISKSEAVDFNILEGVVFYRSGDQNMIQSWKQLCILFDVFREKQLHLIQPAFDLLSSIENLHSSWLLCVYKLLCFHTQNTVNYYAVDRILQSNWCTNKDIFKQSVHLVLAALNKVDYSDASKVSFGNLQKFANNLDNERILALIETSLNIKWIPVSLGCFYMYVIANLKAMFIPITVTLKMIKEVGSVPHRQIRLGCMCILNNFISKNVSFEDVTFIDYIEVAVSVFKVKFTQNQYLKIENRNIFDEIQLDGNFCTELNQKYIFNKFLHATKHVICKYEKDIHDLVLKLLKSEATEDNLILARVICLMAGSFLVLSILPGFEDKYTSDISDIFLSAFAFKFTSKQKLNYLQRRIKSECVEINNMKRIFLEVKFEEFKCSQLFKDAVTILLNNSTKIQKKIAFHFICNEKHDEIISFWIQRLVKFEDKFEVDLYISFLTMYEHYLKTQPVLSQIMIEEMITIFNNLYQLQSCGVIYKIIKILHVLRNKCDENVYLNLIKNCYKHLFCLKQPSEICCLLNVFVQFIINSDFFLQSNDDNQTYASEVLKEILSWSKKQKYFIRIEVSNRLFVPYLAELWLYEDIIRKHERAEYELCVDLQNNTNQIVDDDIIYYDCRKGMYSNCLLQMLKFRLENKTNFIDLFIDVLIDKYNEDFDKRYFPNSQLCLKKMKILQAFLILYNNASVNIKNKLSALAVESLYKENHQNCIKQLLQWLIILLFRSGNQEMFQKIKEIINTSKMQGNSVTSLLSVLCYLTRYNPKEYFLDVMNILLPLTMGPNFKLRLYSQMIITEFYKNQHFLGLETIVGKWQELYYVIEAVVSATEEKAKFLFEKDEFFLLKIDAESHYALGTIFDYLPNINDIISTEINWKACVSQIGVNFFNGNTPSFEEIPIKNTKENSHNNPLPNSVNIQKKIVSLKESSKSCKGDLIVIATLIDSPSNLGGLSRTSEIFGVKELIVNDAKISQNREFQSLSVSSENWIDLIEVKQKDLREHLTSLRNRGYTLIGVEQTSDSVSLSNFDFPKKTALLLGNEKEGICPNYIPLMDYCVDIPQCGVIRSLNVHVAGATFIWEYAKKHLICRNSQ